MGGHIPESLVKALRDRHAIQNAVETGTYKGGTTRFLAKNFRRVWSIEMDAGWHNRALQTLADCKNLELVLGDSRHVLLPILQSLNGPALLWLDAHWCGGARNDQKPEEECPLREELFAVRASDHGHFILIDDARLFTGRPEYPHNAALWPTYEEVLTMLPDRYYTVVHDDRIVSVPTFARSMIDIWMNDGLGDETGVSDGVAE